MKQKNIVFITIIIFICFSFSLCGYFFTYFCYFEHKKPKTDFKNISITSNLKNIYLAIGGTKKLNVTKKNTNEKIKWISDDNNIVTVNDGLVIGNNIGTASVIASINDFSYVFNVTVTDLITVPTYDTDKPYLPCNRYTKEEAELLDKILESRVNEAGYGTRGGVVAAERFLMLEFPYALGYFYENGRLVEHGDKAHIDAEGRYYHKGLYLDESKFTSLESAAISKSGPAIWGCKLYEASTKKYNNNGLTCSGYVTWVLLNGGLEVGDVGAGDIEYRNDDLSDLGNHQIITEEFMKSGKYKVGDYIGSDGHAALIIGIDDEYIYTSESYYSKIKIYKYEKYQEITNLYSLKYIINMDNIYPNGDGIYTDMW